MNIQEVENVKSFQEAEDTTHTWNLIVQITRFPYSQINLHVYGLKMRGRWRKKYEIEVLSHELFWGLLLH